MVTFSIEKRPSFLEKLGLYNFCFKRQSKAV
jgi:hypothetical protein